MDTKTEICKKFERMTGSVPVGLRDILSILTHPDMLDLTKQLVRDAQEENGSN